MNYGFVIDNRRCIGCHACTVACKSEHQVPLGVNRTHVKYVEKGLFPNNTRTFSVHRCNHCEDAPCANICPTSALFTRTDGIVDFDDDRCIGCKSCMQACPYDALYIDPNKHTAAKCNYCTHRVDGGYEPACVIVCPVEAIVSGDLDDPTSKISKIVSKEPVTVRKQEKGTKPNLYYVEGDAFMLDPAASPRREDYLWSEQTGGVGHFAKHADDGSTPKASDHRTTALSENSTDIGKGHRVYDVPSKGVLWGWEVPAYLWTKAISVGTFMMAYLHRWLGGSFTDGTEVTLLTLSLVFLAITGGLLVKDLDRPDRFHYVLLRPNWDSWLVRGAYIITGFGLAVTLMLAALLLDRPQPWLAIPGVVFAVLGAVYTAFLLAQAKGRDLWQSPHASVHMLLHAVLAGLVVVMILEPATREMGLVALKISLPVNLSLILLEWLTPHVSADAKMAVALMTRGTHAPLFYAGMILGNLVPLALAFLAPSLLPVIGLLILSGLFITEHLRVLVPQLIPLS